MPITFEVNSAVILSPVKEAASCGLFPLPSLFNCFCFDLRWLPRVLPPGVTFFVYLAGSLNLACKSQDKLKCKQGGVFFPKIFSNKCVSSAVCARLNKIKINVTVLGHDVECKCNEKSLFSGGIVSVFDHDRRGSHRKKSETKTKFPHFFAVLPVICGASFDGKDETKTRETSSVETHTNRHKHRSTNGRFTKTSRKATEPMFNGLDAQRRLVFDTLDENEPPTKRQTRGDKVQYICNFCLPFEHFIKTKNTIEWSMPMSLKFIVNIL